MQLLTDHLEHWAEQRGVHRAFSSAEFAGPGSPGTHRSLTWAALRDRARDVAAHLTRVAEPGDRAALLIPQGLDYVTAFLGCLYARVVAVPLFTPDLPGHEGRLTAVLADCAPACLLTTAASAASVEEFTGTDLPVLTVDRLPDAAATDLPGPPEPGEVAYLQYTSGSTRTPAGVALTHANAVANARQAITAYDAANGATTVGWLPLFHDMGLVLSIAAPVVGGFPSVLMDPVDFLQEPARWLRLLSRHPGAISAAPNFAFEYCAARVTGEERDELRLERVKALINGSEPVRPATVDRFLEAFAPAGLRPEAHCPSYGLAEATVFVSADPTGTPPVQVTLEREALGQGKAVPAGDGQPDATVVHLVTCGVPAGQELRIVDPESAVAVADGEVGEIWVQGPNIGTGYWGRPGLSAETFRARLQDAPGDWLRTGDLGALYEGALLVTGRHKDLLIVDGRNHYPQDIEETVQNAVPLVRRDRAAAFTVPGATDGAEAAVLVAERGRGAEESGDEERRAADAARAAVSSAHGLRLNGFRLVEPGALPRTSSGKIARSACRDRYLEGSL